MDDLQTFLLARLAEDEASGDADAFPPPGYYPKDEEGQARIRHGMRMLADVDAKRRIIAHAVEWAETLHHTAEGRSEAGNTGYRMAMDWTLRAMSLPYADHEDYRPEWKP